MTTLTHFAAKCIMFVYPVCTSNRSIYESEIKGCSETERLDSVVPFINATGLLFSSSAPLVGSGEVTGRATVADGAVVSFRTSDWLSGQMLAKLPHSDPQCCLHCPRSCRPTHALISPPHFNRKFISSTYGLGWQVGGEQVCVIK